MQLRPMRPDTVQAQAGSIRENYFALRCQMFRMALGVMRTPFLARVVAALTNAVPSGFGQDKESPF
jgi:hypothetical protein